MPTSSSYSLILLFSSKPIFLILPHKLQITNREQCMLTDADKRPGDLQNVIYNGAPYKNKTMIRKPCFISGSHRGAESEVIQVFISFSTLFYSFINRNQSNTWGYYYKHYDVCKGHCRIFISVFIQFYQ